MKIKEVIAAPKFRWFNNFIRNALLAIVITAVQFWTKFNSRWVWFISGMLVVWITWQLSDLINYNRRIE